MTKTQKREAWIAIRERGLLRFVVLNGVLKLGLPAAVLWSLFVHFAASGSSLGSAAGIRTAFLLLPTLGAFYGALVWVILDRKYGPRRGLRT